MLQPRPATSRSAVPRYFIESTAAAAIALCLGCAQQDNRYVSPRRPRTAVAAPRPRSHAPHGATRTPTRPSSTPTSRGTVTRVDGYQNFSKQVLAAPIPAVAMFYVPWCHSCRSMKPIYDSMSGRFANRIRFAKVNLSTNQGLVSKYNISGAPTFVFFQGGREVNRLVGPQPEPILRNALDGLVRR